MIDNLKPNIFTMRQNEMYSSQELLVENKKKITGWLEQYTPDNHPINWQEIENYKIRVPLIGAFSAGKSTLLNSYLGDNLLPLDITPESGVAIEINYSLMNQILAVNHEGLIRELSFEELQSQSVATSIVQEEGWIVADLNRSVLKKAPHITVVDLPGLGSGKDIHSKAIDEYISRSLAYCIVVSAEDGELSATTQAFLQELGCFDLPIVLVVTKADKRINSDVQAVFEKVLLSVEKVMSRKPIASLIVSRRNKEELQQKLEDAFVQLEGQAEKVFVKHVASKILNSLQNVQSQISILLNQEDLTSSDLEVKKDDLERSIQRFRQQVEAETFQLEMSCSETIPSIEKIVQNRLMSQRDSLANAVLNGSNLEESLKHTVRLAITEGVQSEFLPKVSKYLEKIDESMPQSIRVDSNFQLSEASESFPIEAIGFGLMPVLSKVLVAIPYANIITPILTGIASWLISSSRKEDERRGQQEEARSHVDNQVIPQIMSQVRSVVGSYLNAQILKAKDTILEKANLREKELQYTINTLLIQLNESQAQFAKIQGKYESDYAEIQDFMQKISVIGK